MKLIQCLILTGFVLFFATWAWADHRPRTHDRGGAPADIYAPPPIYQPYPYSSPYGKPLDLQPPPVYRPWPPDYRPTPDPWPYGSDKPRRGRSIWDD